MSIVLHGNNNQDVAYLQDMDKVGSESTLPIIHFTGYQSIL
jgi:hypothetical protein